MYTYDDCDRFLRKKIDEELGKDNLHIHNAPQYKLDIATNDVIGRYGFGPHDLVGHTIKVGDKCAVALTFADSANLAIIEVVDIINGKIKGKNIIRTYSSVGADKIITYQYPERMIVLNN